METETIKIPTGAMHFMDHDCFAKADDKDQMDMVIYSGGVIPNHFWWGNLAIDLEGIKFPKSKYPVLEGHDTSKKIGFSGKPTVDGQLRINKMEFVDTPESKEFIRLSKEGFPYQASMYIPPAKIERIPEGEKAKVNGITLKGPGTIFRESTFKEASVCVFGYDSNTKATAFGTEEIEMTVQNLNALGDQTLILDREEVTHMNLAELTEKHPELLSEITESVRTRVTAELTATFTQEKKDLKKTMTDKFNQERDGLEGKVQGLEEKVLKAEKAEAIRTVKELKLEAQTIWTRKLSQSNVSENMYEKIVGHVSHEKFVKDDVLDTEAFGTAIDAEIKDWEGRGATSTVLGAGFSVKDTEDSESKKAELEDKADEDLADSLFAASGGNRTKKGGE